MGPVPRSFRGGSAPATASEAGRQRPTQRLLDPNNMGPLMVPVLIQYLQLRERLQGVVLSVERPDKILWR
jgi:hypothetical protein